MAEPNEHQRRQSLTADVVAHFKAHRHEWIDAHELAKVGGFCAWRSMVSDARQIIEAEPESDDTIVWNGSPRHSAYRLQARPLGRDASVPTVPLVDKDGQLEMWR